MNRENEQSIIEDTDMQIIKEIAEKYNLSMKDLSMIIARGNSVNVKKPLQVRFTNSEYNRVKKAADERDLKVTIFVRHCLKCAQENHLLKNMGLKDLTSLSKRDTDETRTKRVPVSFEAGEYYLEIKDFAEQLAIPYSSIIRWIILKSIDERKV